MGPVLLATDLGPTSADAESDAIELARDQRRPLVILSVIDPNHLRLPGGLWHTRVDQDRQERELSMLALVERARARGVAARFLVWEGKPGEAILEAARAEDASVIVVGSHRRGRLGRLVLGSVSRHVVERADRPVVVAEHATEQLAGQPLTLA